MARNLKFNDSLTYLYNAAKKINFKIVAGPKLHPIQMYDLIYDDVDLKIRRGEVRI